MPIEQFRPLHRQRKACLHEHIFDWGASGREGRALKAIMYYRAPRGLSFNRPFRMP